jgi:hypothetical protein
MTAKRITIICEEKPMTTSTPALNEPAVPASNAKGRRPTTPEAERMFFTLCAQLTKRETTLFMWFIGRSDAAGLAVREAFREGTP